MVECPHCGEFIKEKAGEREKSRCPRCHEPVFERVGGPRLVAEGEIPERGICATHPGNVGLGTCKRCGNFVCPVCRTRWQDKMLCLNCVRRQLQEQGSQTEEQKKHRRQASLGFFLGLCAWIIVVLALGSLIPAEINREQQSLAALGSFLILFSLLPALLGIGQAASAIRLRGSRMILATAGLVLSGSHVGIFLGLILLAVRNVPI